MDAADYDSRTALMIACSHGAAEAAAVLVALPGIKLDAADHFGDADQLRSEHLHTIFECIEPLVQPSHVLLSRLMPSVMPSVMSIKPLHQVSLELR